MTRNATVRTQSYGKSQVRLSYINRTADHHDFIELTAWIELEGDFGTAYTAADNTQVVPTDTIKNTLYVLAARAGIHSIEEFSLLLGRHFLGTYPQVAQVDVRLEQTIWSRLSLSASPHPHAFVGGTSERSICRVTMDRETTHLSSGFKGLQVLKTTGSGFAGFLQDEYTTLGETDDRILATAIEAVWPCMKLDADWPGIRQMIRTSLLDVFANQYSCSVQQTLYQMAQTAFSACPLVNEISITMPNQHHLLVDLNSFGLQNPNVLFVPTSEPFGRISATIARNAAELPS